MYVVSHAEETIVLGLPLAVRTGRDRASSTKCGSSPTPTIGTSLKRSLGCVPVEEGPGQGGTRKGSGFGTKQLGEEGRSEGKWEGVLEGKGKGESNGRFHCACQCGGI